MPSCNGGVERANRTIIQLLKGLVDKSGKDWDLSLPKAVIVYNSTVHSQISISPSDFILRESHNLSHKIPISRESSGIWKEGHPKFTPFLVGQSVLRKIKRTGNLLKFKLEPRFEGPFTISKVQSNNVSYLIKHPNRPGAKEIPVHYRQLKAFADVPSYLSTYVRFDSVTLQSDLDINSSDNSSDSSREPFLCRPPLFISSSPVESSSSSEVTRLSSSCESDAAGFPASNRKTMRSSSTEEEANQRKITDSKLENSLDNLILEDCNLAPVPESPVIVADEGNQLGNFEDGVFFIPRSISSDFSRTGKTKSLSDFSCSEPMNNEMMHIKASTPVSANALAHDSSTCGSDIKGLEEFFDKLCINSPKLRPQVQPPVVGGDENFANFMEEAWTVSSARIDNIIDTISASSCRNKSDDFAGFGEDDGRISLDSDRIKTLMKEIRDQSLMYKGISSSYKRGNNQFLRDIWQKHLLCSETRLRHNPSFSDLESHNQSARRLSFNSPIATRSRGPVLDLPNVQEKTLEYKSKK